MANSTVAPRVVFGLWLALAAVTVTFAMLNRPLTGELSSLDSVDFVFVVASVLFAAVSALVGLVVASRTRHVIGWLFFAFAITLLLPLLGEQYAFYGIVTALGSLPAPSHSAALAYASFALVVPALILILALFPTGRSKSPRWRVVTFATPIVAVLYAVASAVQPSSTAEDSGWHEVDVVVDNPLAIEGVDWVLQLPGALGTLVIALFFAAVVSVIMRFRGSRGVERQQIKALAYVALTAGLILLSIIAASLLAAGTRAENAVGSIGWGLLVATIALGFPLAIGASILRYRLYDIDRLISRTLSYAVVTAVLGGTFVVVALVPTALLGTGKRPDWVVAVATLAVAALFRPVRRRVQDTVDHRFNRARYDASRTVEAFALRLREEIDIDALGAELAAVVGRTMHPQHVSLWMRAVVRR